MALELKTAATVTPVTLAEAKTHLRVDTTDDDALITNLIAAVTDAVERECCTQLCTATWILRLPEWWSKGEWYTADGGYSVCDGTLNLPRSPVSAIVALKYWDTAGVEQTLANTVYELEKPQHPQASRLRLAYDQTWPSCQSREMPISIEMTCGFGAAAAVPGLYKALINLWIANLYENRESSVTGTIVTEVPHALERLIALGRVWV